MSARFDLCAQKRSPVPGNPRFASSTGHMVPYGVGLRRPNMGFAGICLIVTPRGPDSRNDRCEVSLPSSRQGLFRFRGISLRSWLKSQFALADPYSNSVPSTQIACMMSAIFRATAIAARLNPARL